jgi:type VI secretion system protein ImpK
MTPEFAQAVDPVFEHVIGLLDRIEMNRSRSGDEERREISLKLGAADARLGTRDDWRRLGKYALVCWIDEVLVDSPWAFAEWWEENALEKEFFDTHDRFEEFYRHAEEALRLPQRDALEVFFLAVVLGFRGRYRFGTDTGRLPSDSGGRLPPDLESWARRIGRAIQAGQSPPPLPASVLGPQTGVPPLLGRMALAYAAVGTAFLAGILALLASFWFDSGP